MRSTCQPPACVPGCGAHSLSCASTFSHPMSSLPLTLAREIPMFDDPRVQANGHLPQSQGAELFSAELEPVHELLLATSEAWRADLPASDRLAAFARSLPSADTPAAKPI